MAGLRDRIEHGFSILADRVYTHRIKTLLFFLLFAAAFVSQLPKIGVDTSTEGFLHEDDPALSAYEAFRDQFGRDEVIIIALKPRAVFAFDFLSRLQKLHRDLEDNLPYLDEVTSLVNARDTRGEADALIVEDLLQTWPETSEELTAIAGRARANPLYRNMLLSPDGTFTTVIVRTRASAADSGGAGDLAGFEEEFDIASPTPQAAVEKQTKAYLTDAQNGEVVKAVEQIVRRHDFPDTQVYVAGTPVVTHFLKKSMMRDMRKFMAIALGTIALFLLLMFRRLSGLLLPILIVVLSLLCTVGLMAALGVSLKLPTQILPSFILAVGVGDAVHILVIFFRRLQFNNGDKREAVTFSLGHSGLAVLMTSLTTAGGLLSFSTAAVAPVADLGRFAAFGVTLALIFTIFLLPALISISPIRLKRTAVESQDSKQSLADRLLLGCGRLSIRHPVWIISVYAVIIGFSIAGITKIYFSHNPLKWLPPHSAVRTANEKIDSELNGSTSLEVVVDTGRENGLYDPDILNRLEHSITELSRYRKGIVFVGKAWSLTTVLKEINQALHANNPDYYAIPQDRQLIAQEFMLFENSGSDDLEDFTDSRFSKARFIIKVPFVDAINFMDLIETVESHFTEGYPEADITVTGMASLFVRVISSAIKSMRESYVYAFLVITILMIVLIGRVRIGLLSMIPNLTPILITLGMMGWTGTPMHLFNMLVGSIAIGLAVDDTIHFMHNFRRYYENSGDPAYAVLETLHTTGRAMLVTTCVLSIGFFTFAFSEMKNLFEFGILTGFTLVMALLADYLLAPALMILVNRKKISDSLAFQTHTGN